MRNPTSAQAKQLTPRDTAILQWVGQAGIASLDQVARRFWSGRSLQTGLRRMRRLVRAGYLEMHFCNVRRPGEVVFCMAEWGYRQFSSAQRERLQVGLPAPAEIAQQLLAQDAYIEIEAQVRREGGRLVGWRSERELRAEFVRSRSNPQQRERALSTMSIPDAQAMIITAHGEMEIIDIEVDGAYYGKMFWQKAKRLSESGHQVVWVCTQARASYVQKAVTDYPNIRILLV